MIIYVGIYLYLVLLLFVQNKRLLFLLSFSVLAFFLNLSYTNGIDWTSYQLFYITENYVPRGIEYGYSALQFIFYKLGFNFEMFKFSVLTFDLFLIYKFIFSKSKFPAFVIMIAFQTFLLGNFFEPAIRQIQALVIFLFSLKYLHEKQLIKYNLMISFAVLFHQSAFFLFFLQFMPKRLRYNHVIGIGLVVVLFESLISQSILSLTSIGIFSDYQFYLGTKFLEGNTASIFNIAKTLVYILPIYLLRNYRRDDDEINFLRNMSYLFVFFYFAQFTFLIFYRINFYFIIIYLVYISNIFNLFQLNSNKIMFYAFYAVIHLISLTNLINFYENVDRMKYSPYTNYFILYIEDELYDDPYEKVSDRIRSRWDQIPE